MGLLGASWAILASEVHPGRRLGPVLGAFWSGYGAYWGRIWGAFGAPRGLPGKILFAQSASFRIKWISVVALHLGCH